MKRILCIFLCFAIALSLCSCGGNAESQASGPQQGVDAQPSESVQPSSDSTEDGGIGLDSVGDIDVEQGLFNVTLTIPSDFLDEGMTQDQLDQVAKENGYKSATLNDDGSATYVMTKAQHQEMMSGIKESIDTSLSEMANSEEYPTIVKVEANGDYTQYKVFLNVEEVGLSESIAVMGFYIFSGMYHVFNGTEPGNVNVQYISESTGEIIQEANSSDMG